MNPGFCRREHSNPFTLRTPKLRRRLHTGAAGAALEGAAQPQQEAAPRT